MQRKTTATAPGSSHSGIKTPLHFLHDFNEKERTALLLVKLSEGASLR
jgi:hypothetical protein